MKRQYKRIQYSVTVGHAEWRRVRRNSVQTAAPQPPFSQKAAEKWRSLVERAAAIWERLTKKQMALISLALGLFVGLVVLGWWLTPVQWDASEWQGANFHNLPVEKRALVIDNSADLFSYTLDQGRVTALLADWPTAADDICRQAAVAGDDAAQVRYEALLYIATGRLCEEE